jgi:hypothetical protein
MANPQYPAFTLTGKAFLLCGATSANVALSTSGSPSCAIVSNPTEYPAWVLLGTSNAVAVTTATGVIVLPQSSITLALASNTYLAGIGQGANLDIALGD